MTLHIERQQRGTRLIGAIVLVVAGSTVVCGTGMARVASHRVLHAYPHDSQAFTQGLAFVEGTLYEGTGLQGHSGIRRVDLETGAVLQEQRLASAYFGEGITVWRETLVQLTYRSQVGFVYDRKTLRLIRSFPYAGEGWRLTHDGRRLIMSDGTAILRFSRSPATHVPDGLVNEMRPIHPFLDALRKLERHGVEAAHDRRAGAVRRVVPPRHHVHRGRR